MSGITFYATLDSGIVRASMPIRRHTPVLLPASSWARLRSSRDKPLPIPALPLNLQDDTERAADSGGFVASFRHGGEYQYTPAQYVDWLRAWQPAWAALMDFCVEQEITGKNDGIVRQRQQRTTEMAWAMWRDYRHEPWCWVPTIQGWNLDDYVRHAREMRPLIEEMADYYGRGSAFRVGIGTLCRRANVAMIRAVAASIAAELPGVSLHLWGIKLGALRSRLALPAAVISVDSAAWDGMTGPHERSYPAGYHEYRDAGQGTQAQFALTVAMPRYLAKVEAAQAQTKQLLLL